MVPVIWHGRVRVTTIIRKWCGCSPFLVVWPSSRLGRPHSWLSALAPLLHPPSPVHPFPALSTTTTSMSSSSSSSSWGKKLANKLNALNEASSTELLQTVAKWLGFNRKHAVTAFVPVLKETLLSPAAQNSVALQIVYLSVVHEVLVLDRDIPEKWDKMEELRVTLAENVLLPTLASWQEPTRAKLTSFIKEWDNANALAGPTLINQLRNAVATAANADATPDKQPPSSGLVPNDEASTKVSSSDSPPNATSSETNAAINNTNPTASLPEIKTAEKAPLSTNVVKTEPVSATTTTTTPTFDFDATDIPAAPVETKTLLESTRTLASLQIARDLRNDGAVQLSSLLSGLPDKIKQHAASTSPSATEYEGDVTAELTADTLRDFAMQTPDELLDMDLEEQLQSIRMYRDIIKQQLTSRKELIHALIQSRCEFGAHKVADAFDNADRSREELQKRKLILIDAMELEGRDVAEEEKTNGTTVKNDFAPLEWHKKRRTA